jgi:hypothetical protein
MPVMTPNDALRVLLEVVVTGTARGSVHPTGTWLPSTETVGWSAVPLHSEIPPGLPAKTPLAVTVTISPPVRHLPGVTVIWTDPEVDEDDAAAQGAVVVVFATTDEVVVAGVVFDELPQAAIDAAQPIRATRRAKRLNCIGSPSADTRSPGAS